MAEKTEKPTQKKLNDGAKKGQILKSRDAVVTSILLVGIGYLYNIFSFKPILDIIANIIDNGFILNIEDYVSHLMITAFNILFPFIAIVSISVCIVSWVQSRFKIATESVKLNFNALNPVSGFKKMFSLRTIKEFIKTILYMVSLTVALYLFWVNMKNLYFITLYGELISLLDIWNYLLLFLVIYSSLSLVVLIVLDLLAEYFLFMKDMKMEKEEIKREYKEQEGSPELKSKRKQLHNEILSEQLKSDINNSRLIIANPTHIAIGIYFKPEISPIPIVSVRETEQVALAVRQYAELNDIPVIRNISLARKLFNTHQRYDFVSLDYADKVIQLLFWLEDIEKKYVVSHNDDSASSVEKNPYPH